METDSPRQQEATLCNHGKTVLGEDSGPAAVVFLAIWRLFTAGDHVASLSQVLSQVCRKFRRQDVLLLICPVAPQEQILLDKNPEVSLESTS